MSETNERIETVKVTRLPMGSAIPEWLLTQEPLVAGAPRGAFRFDVDVDIVEYGACFQVFPVLPLGEASTCSVLDFRGMSDHHVYATSKPVQVIHQINHVLSVEMKPMVDRMRAARMEFDRRAGFVPETQPPRIVRRPLGHRLRVALNVLFGR